MQAPEELEPTTKSWAAMRTGDTASRRDAMRRAIVGVDRWGVGRVVIGSCNFDLVGVCCGVDGVDLD